MLLLRTLAAVMLKNPTLFLSAQMSWVLLTSAALIYYYVGYLPRASSLAFAPFAIAALSGILGTVTVFAPLFYFFGVAPLGATERSNMRLLFWFLVAAITVWFLLANALFSSPYDSTSKLLLEAVMLWNFFTIFLLAGTAKTRPVLSIRPDDEQRD